MDSDITDRKRPSAMDSPVMEVEYVLDPEDHVACRLFLGLAPQISTTGGRSLRASDLFLILAFLLIPAPILWTFLANPSLLVADLMTALAVLLMAVILLLRGPPQPARDQLLVVKETVERLRALGVVKIGRRDHVRLDSEGFTEVNDHREAVKGMEVAERRETRVSWSEVPSIAVAERHVIFTVTAKGYLFVPKRAFADEATFFRFVETARTLRRAFLERGRTDVTLDPPGGRSDGIQLAP